MLSLQLFLLFTAAPFMVLAVLVEQHGRDEQALRAKMKNVYVSRSRPERCMRMSGIFPLTR